jgi:hypothetical protein
MLQHALLVFHCCAFARDSMSPKDGHHPTFPTPPLLAAESVAMDGEAHEEWPLSK